MRECNRFTRSCIGTRLGVGEVAYRRSTLRSSYGGLERDSSHQKGGKPSRGKKGRQGGTLQEGVGQGLEGDDDDDFDDRHPPVQQCKEEFCLAKEDNLQALLEKSLTMQEASIRARRRKAAASARAVVSEAARDDKQEELQDIISSLQSGESTWQSLRNTLSSVKAHCTVLGEIMHDLSADKARHKREEAVDSMPAHLRRSLPSGLAEARRGLNFSSPPSRLTRSTSRPKTVFAILEDGMPGGRLETRQGGSSVGSTFVQGALSESSPNLEQEHFGLWPTTPPRCRQGTAAKFPPLQLPVSPIQSGSSVGGVLTLDEDEITKRRDRQKSRLRRRAKEWGKVGGGIGYQEDDEGHNHNRPEIDRRRRSRSMTANDSGLDRRRSAWASPSSRASPSPSPSLSQLSPPHFSAGFC